jgi:sortase A
LTTRTRRRAVGHIPGTAPWGAGNVALAGHRDTFFRGLSRVRLDDVIELETLRGTFKYRVERITVVGAQDVEVVQSPNGT